ncbi:hypothetical protein STCU_11986 [Strigomonas culicis]|uniref:Choline transporter-like protein n=1 Tax=Strigomonas culicis TaxID=28005 RepID=S9TGL0_9TRYP|nr:hypothetical protein STCU_11986 [Strigomonas culicis]|eukprot:EPY15488.1 hypothetical protein STCU_11986 [Strigomonas culicis]
MAVWGGVNLHRYHRIVAYVDTTLPSGDVVRTDHGAVRLAHGLGAWSLALCMGCATGASCATVSLFYAAVLTRPAAGIALGGGAAALATLAAGVLLLCEGAVVAGALALLLAPFPLFWLLLGRPSLALTTAFLATSGRVVRLRARACAAAGGLLTVLLLLLATCWCCAAYPCVDRIAAEAGGPADYVALVGFLLVLLWAGEVCGNLLCLFACEITAMWYYAGRLPVPDAVYDDGWRRAGTSLGSVCLGSLLQWLMQYLFIFVTRGAATEPPSVRSVIARRVRDGVTPPRAPRAGRRHPPRAPLQPLRAGAGGGERHALHPGGGAHVGADAGVLADALLQQRLSHQPDPRRARLRRRERCRRRRLRGRAQRRLCGRGGVARVRAARRAARAAEGLRAGALRLLRRGAGRAIGGRRGALPCTA